ncbi:hypothetical protein GF339_07890, partial [candidate division KSB3 bacterium]|nr:hypothetical protein [candidate division KSB3 bacterium]MBD3324491.1 hypothetical protein [candidate division KSB3 bacterium]
VQAMPVVTVLYGPAYDGKNAAAFAPCLQALRRHEGETCLYVVRSEVRARQLRGQILQELPGWFHLPICTFPDFIKQLYRRLPGNRRIIGDLEQALFLEESLKTCEQMYGGHFAFARFREYPGMIATIQAFLNAIRRVGIGSAQMLEARMGAKSEARRQVQAQLLTVFRLYEARLETTHSIDENGVFLEVAAAIAAPHTNLRALLPAGELDLLVLEGYYDLTPPGEQIFTALCSQYERTILTLDLPCNPYALPEASELPPHLRIFQDMVAYVRHAGLSVREFSRPASPPESCQTTDLLADARVNPQRITLTSYRDRYDEVTEIARTIRQLYRERQIRDLSEVGVTFPVIELYEHLIREIFPAFGIPFTMFQGYALDASPVTVTILRMLQVVVERYDRETLAHFFTSPLIRFDARVEAGEQAYDASASLPGLTAETYLQLDSLARLLGITGGKETWSETLRAYAQSVEDQGGIEADPVVVHHLLPLMLEFLEFMSMFDAEPSRSIDDWVDILLQGIQRLQIPARVLATEERTLRKSDLAAFQRLVQLLETFQRELTGSSHLTLKEFYDLLVTAIQKEAYYPPQALDDSVFIMGRLDTRQVRFRYLFFGGLVERDFPGQQPPYIFLSEQEAAALGLPTYRNTVQEAAYLFYLNVCNPTEHLYLSFPLREGEHDLLRSAYVERLRHALFPEDADVPLEEVHEEVRLEDRYTSSEWYQWAGAHLAAAEALPSRLNAGDTPLTPPELVLRSLQRIQGQEAVETFLKGVTAQTVRMADALSAYDGVLTSVWARHRLDGRYARHVFAVAEFDLYARCPIKFFFRRLLGLEPLPELLSEMTAVDIGLVLHRILYRFYAETSRERAPSGPGNVDRAFVRRKVESAEWMQEARRKMAALAEEELERYPFSGAFWESFRDTLLAGLEAPESSEADYQGVLAKFLEREANDADHVVPCYLEARFGMSDISDPSEAALPGYRLAAAPVTLQGTDRDGNAQSLRLRGSIDRIDLERQTPHAPRHDRLKAVIYDYKTGRTPSGPQMKSGRFFQLPLYLLAAQECLGETVDVVAGGYYQLRSPQEVSKKGYLGSQEAADQGYVQAQRGSLSDTPQAFQHLLREYADRALGIAQNIRRGRFHPTLLTPQEAGCAFCEYQQICRVETFRLRKIQPPDAA